MSTQAQKARNARKRAKLKLHKQQQKPWRDMVGPGWSIIKVSRRERKLWISWTHTIYVVVEGDPWLAPFFAWHPGYNQMLDRILDRMGDQECDPATIRADVCFCWFPTTNSVHWYKSECWNEEYSYDLSFDLKERYLTRIRHA